MVKEYLSQIIHDLELRDDTLSNPEVGVFDFVVDEETTVRFSELDEGIYILSKICEPPTLDVLEFYTKLMNANVFGSVTYGSVLGMTEDNKFITLTRLIEDQPTFQEFRNTFEDYVNAAKFWQSKAKEHLGPV